MDEAKGNGKGKAAKSNSDDSKGAESGGEKANKDSAQIRSRITVVCKECKRLKLRCDRKAPCGSCLKRGTVPNCEYSQQATEKIDLQSLNNRIMDLEMALLRVTQGLPANYVPTYPPVQARAIDDGFWSGESHPGAQTSSTAEPLQTDHSVSCHAASSTGAHSRPHTHHHHLAAPRIPDATRSGEEAANRAFRDLQGLRPHPSASPDGEASNSLKYEHNPSGGADVVMSSATISKSLRRQKSKSGASGAASTGPDPLGSVRRQQQHQAQLSLPPRKAFYPIETTDKQSPVALSSVSATWRGAEPPRPGITANLCRALPAPSVCASLITSARESFATRPTELGLPLVTRGKGGLWSVFENRCKKVYDKRSSFSAVPGAKNKGKAASKVSVGDLVTTPSEAVPPPVDLVRDTLTFFALMCAVMAVGASRRPAGDSDDNSATPAFLLALSQQAQDVYLESGQRALGTSQDVDEMIREERVEYIRASIVQISCLLELAAGPLSSLSPNQHADKETLLRIIGKMVTALQTWGHATGLFAVIPGDHTLDAIAAEVQESRKRTWWEALAYDSLVSEALGKPCLAPSAFYNVDLPELEGDATPVKHSRENVETAGEAPRLRLERLFLAVRARLTQLVHTVNVRMSVPGCCCGYTLDQAVRLWSEIQQWIKAVPHEFSDAFELKSSSKLVGLGKDFDVTEAGSRASSYPSDEREDTRDDRLWQQSMSCDLALVAYSLVLKVFAPFAALALSRDASPDAARDFQLPTREYIFASEAVIRISKVIKARLEPASSSSPKPIVLATQALGKRILDATVACSIVTTAFAQGLGFSERSGEGPLELMHSVRLGLDLLEDQGYLPDDAKEDVQKLRNQWKEYREKLKASSSHLKRKWGTVEDGEVFERRGSPGPVHDGWARSSDDDPDDRMDGGGGGGGHHDNDGDRGPSSDSFSRPSSVTGSYDDHRSYGALGPGSNGWGTASNSSSSTPIESSAPRLHSIMLSRAPSRHSSSKQSGQVQVGIRVRLNPEGKPLDRKKGSSRTVSRRSSNTDMRPVQLRLEPPSTGDAVETPDQAPQQSPTNSLSLSHRREAPMYSMARGSMDGGTPMGLLGSEPPHNTRSKMFHDYPHILPLSAQTTGEQPPANTPYVPTENYGFTNGYGYTTPTGVVRHSTCDSSMGHGDHVDVQSTSPTYSPSLNVGSHGTGDYFVQPTYGNTGPFTPAMMSMHDSQPATPFYPGYYSVNPMSSSPTNWPAAATDSSHQWNPNGQPSWQQP